MLIFTQCSTLPFAAINASWKQPTRIIVTMLVILSAMPYIHASITRPKALACTYKCREDVTPLMLAALNNDTAEVRAILAEDEVACVNAQTYNGITALFLALRHNARSSDIVQMLIDAGANIALIHPYKCSSPFSCRDLIGENEETIRKNRLRLNRTGAHNSFEIACANRHDSVVKALIDYDQRYYKGQMLKQYGASGLRHAAFGGAIGVIELLLNAGVFVAGIDPGYGYDTANCTALKVAALNQQKEAARVLLANGANLDTFDFCWEHALAHAYALPIESAVSISDPDDDPDRESPDIICPRYETDGMKPTHATDPEADSTDLEDDAYRRPVADDDEEKRRKKMLTVVGAAALCSNPWMSQIA